MLEELHIKDFALIREVRIVFGPSLNLITGETGAGKSIILGALGLVLGSKATTDLIRTGASRSIVEASLSIGSSQQTKPLFDFLEEKGLEIEDNYLIIKREINTEGRGRSFVNGSQVPVSILREIGRFLVDIHGQNEHQNILNISTHRRILDRFATLQENVTECSRLFKERQALTQKLSSVSLDEAEKNRRLEILTHEINEIESANLVDELELDELISLEKSLANAEAILQDLNSVYQGLQENEPSTLTTMSQMIRMLEGTSKYDDGIADDLNNFREAYYLIEDVARSLRARTEAISVDPERLMQVRERIDLLQTLFNKYGGTVAQVLAHLDKARNEFTGIELSSEEEARLREQIANVESALVKQAIDLSKKRRAAAANLEEKVKAELKDLGMPDTQFRISIKWEFGENGIYQHSEQPGKKYLIHPHGLDLVEFLIASSENETLRPLKKVASGGEMSRIMLALKKVIIDSDPVLAMVFDEVDAGVGGAVAEAVGNKLADLAANAQVMVITHLHQIASMSPENTLHYRVSKSANEGTKITRLSQDGRVDEVARMIAGEKISPSAIEHAKTLLQVT